MKLKTKEIERELRLAIKQLIVWLRKSFTVSFTFTAEKGFFPTNELNEKSDSFFLSFN